MLINVSFRGGARIGWVNASWPFATLNVSRDELRISSLGKYTFSPTEVVSIEPYGSIPVISSGIRINHNRADDPSTIVFWCMGNRSRVLSAIAEAGFIGRGSASLQAREFPIRWSVVIAVIALWNMLLFFQVPGHLAFGSGSGALAPLAVAGLFALCTAVRLSSRIQRVALREGHQVGEIKSFLSLLQLVSGLLTIVFTGMWLGGANVA